MPPVRAHIDHTDDGYVATVYHNPESDQTMGPYQSKPAASAAIRDLHPDIDITSKLELAADHYEVLRNVYCSPQATAVSVKAVIGWQVWHPMAGDVALFAKRIGALVDLVADGYLHQSNERLPSVYRLTAKGAAALREHDDGTTGNAE